jgi:low affinity Fe/Cu permease
MIALAWSALTSRIAGPIASAVAVALGLWLAVVLIQNGGLKGEVTARTAERDAAIANYARCQSNRITLETAVSSQNAAVEAWRKEAADRSREAEKAMQRARAGAVEANRRADAIRRQVSRDACGDDLILGSVR